MIGWISFGGFLQGKLSLNKSLGFYLLFNSICNLNNRVVTLLELRLQLIECREDREVA